MSKSLVKGALIPLMAAFVLSLLLSACKKPTPEADFDYNIESGLYYATCHVRNHSVNADSYEWTLTRPNGTYERSTSVEPSFLCYDVGTYNLTMYASNKYGMDRCSKSFNIYYIDNGNHNGGDNGDDNNPTAVSYTIKWLRLEKIPMLDDNNGSWDTGLFGGGDPDIKFKIQNSNNTTTYYTSPTKTDVSSSALPVSWYDVNTTLELGKEYRILFLDEDGVLDTDDAMANCVWEQSGHFVPGMTTFTWNGIDGRIKFTVGLSWTYSKGEICSLTQAIPDNNPVEGNNTPIHNQQ